VVGVTAFRVGREAHDADLRFRVFADGDAFGFDSRFTLILDGERDGIFFGFCVGVSRDCFVTLVTVAKIPYIFECVVVGIGTSGGKFDGRVDIAFRGDGGFGSGERVESVGRAWRSELTPPPATGRKIIRNIFGACAVVNGVDECAVRVDERNGFITVIQREGKCRAIQYEEFVWFDERVVRKSIMTGFGGIAECPILEIDCPRTEIKKLDIFSRGFVAGGIGEYLVESHGRGIVCRQRRCRISRWWHCGWSDNNWRKNFKVVSVITSVLPFTVGVLFTDELLVFAGLDCGTRRAVA